MMMYAAFFELPNQLYRKGYAENLQEEDPNAFDQLTTGF